MGVIASQIISLTIVFSTVYLDTDQIKHQSSASLAFVRGIHRRPVNCPDKWPVTRKMFPFDDAWINGWVNNREAGDWRRYRAHCDVIVMSIFVGFKMILGHVYQPHDVIQNGRRDLEKISSDQSFWHCYKIFLLSAIIKKLEMLWCQFVVIGGTEGCYGSSQSRLSWQNLHRELSWCLLVLSGRCWGCRYDSQQSTLPAVT